MAQKCVHKSCGKTFTDPEEPCIFHPGPPIFHEGQKGWKCCKPRVLTFNEFLAIPPCTTGKHSTIDDTPAEPPKPIAEDLSSHHPASNPSQAPAEPQSTVPVRNAIPQNTAAAAVETEPESEEDNEALPIPPNTICRRRACNVTSTDIGAHNTTRGQEECIHHPGHPIFHEGSKGWSCCKRRVLEFDEFLKIEGCETKPRHMFVGSGKKSQESSGEKTLKSVRHDFYQTGTTVHASLYLKKISKDQAKIEFESPTSIKVNLPTADKTRYEATIPLFGSITPAESSFRILGTKLELTLAKADGQGWPVLRADERQTGEIIQTGKAARAP